MCVRACVISCAFDIVRVCVCLPVFKGACCFFWRECVYVRACMRSCACLTVREFVRVCVCI